MQRRNFWSDERGLATIEWVGLAAVAFIAAIAISGTLLGGANNLGGAVAGQMNGAADGMNGTTPTP